MNGNSYQSLRDSIETRNPDWFFKAMFDCSQEGIFAFDRVGRCRMVNAAGGRMTGEAPEEWVGRSYKQLCRDEDGAKLEALFQGALLGISGDCTISLAHIDDLPCPVNLTVTALEVEGDVQGVFFTARSSREMTEREIHYAAAQRVAHLGSWELDVSSGSMYWSDETYRIFGLQRGEVELTFATFLQYVHPEDVEHVISVVEQAQKSGPTALEHRIVLPDGTVRVLVEEGEPLVNAEGRTVKLVGVVQDITERVRADQELREAKEELATILRQQLGITFKFRKTGDEFVYTMAEGQLLRHLGLAPEEVVGRRLADMFAPSMYEHRANVYQRAWDGESVVYESAYNGYVYIVSLQPLFRDGEVYEVLASGMDVTSRKRATEELRTAKEQLETFIEYNADAIKMFDAEGYLLHVNPAFERLFGWTLEEMRGQHMFDLQTVPDRCRDSMMSILEKAQQGEAMVGVETKRLTRNGCELDVLISVSPTFDTRGGVTGWSVIMRDITEQKKAEQLLVQSEKLTIAGQLAAGIAHEIRNPLTSLKGFTQLMKVGTGQQEQYLAIMESELSRIEMILSELLVLAKPQAERFQLSDLGPIVTEVRALIESQAILHNIEIQCDAEPDLPSVACDPNQLKQVFLNFLKNAIEAMKKGGVIRVEVQRDGEEQVLVRFMDQGCGIPKERVARLGEPFYTTKEHGTGLGMMVSKRIIENHRGRMHVESEVGVGTTIEVRFPCGELGGEEEAV